MTKPWRALEQLVQDLERVFAGEDVVIRSPDRLLDRTTGRQREVDVTRRRKVGSAEILVAVECRKRGDPEDVTWIEQLATKADDLGVSKMIAVSSSRFTAGAVDKAAAKNVELRTFNEITEGTAMRWLGGVCYRYDLDTITVKVKDSPVIAAVPDGTTLASGVDETIFVSLVDGAELSLFQAFPVKAVLSDAANTLQLGERQLVEVRIKPEQDGLIGVRTESGIVEVVMIGIETWAERRLATATSASYQYRDQRGEIIASGTEVLFDHFGHAVRLNYARHADGTEAGFVMRREDHDRNWIIECDLAFVGNDGPRVISFGPIKAVDKPTGKRKRDK